MSSLSSYSSLNSLSSAYEVKELKLEDVEAASHTVSGRGECERVKRRGSVDPNAVPANLVPFNWMPFGRYAVPIQWNG